MRGPIQRGDTIVVSTVAGASSKSYPLAAIPNNVSYDDVSDQPEAQPNQPLAWPLSFHGGLAYSKYDPKTAGCLINDGMILNEPNIIRPPLAPTTVTLTNANAPPMYFFEAVAPNATITFDATSNDKTSSAATTLTWSHTVGSGSDRILVVYLSNLLAAGPTSVTYGGTALLQLSWVNSGAAGTVNVYYLLAPSTGTDDIVATYASADDIVGGATSWSNVTQWKGPGTTAGSFGAGTTASITVPSASGQVVLDVLTTSNPIVTATVGASQTQRWNETIAATVVGAGSQEPGAASVTMSWGLSSNANWVMATAQLAPADKPVLYVITVEESRVSVYKISLQSSNYGTLLNTKNFAVRTTQPMGQPAEWNNGTNTYWTLGQGDEGLIQQLTGIASGTSNDTWTASGDADARHLCVVDNQLIRTTGANETCFIDRGEDPMTEANWSDEFYVGDASKNVTAIAEASGEAYFGDEAGFFEWDTVGEAHNILPAIGEAERNGQGMAYWHGGFKVPARSGLWWTRTGKPIGPDDNPKNRANEASLGSTTYAKHGRWMGGWSAGEYSYDLYVDSAGTSAYLMWSREREEGDPQGWGPIVWHSIASPTADVNDFHGVYVSETSEYSSTETRPCLWYADGNDVSYIWLDKDGAPQSRRGDIDLAASGSVTSGQLDFGLPKVNKQFRVIEGWAEDFSTNNGTMQFSVAIDGGSFNNVGSTISTDGHFEAFFTQDSNDTGRSMLVKCTWAGGSSRTDTNGPHLRDVVIRATALPDTTRVWSFLMTARDEAARTGKLVRSELESYKNDLEKYELPDGDSFNGVLAKIRLMRADEVQNLTPRGQEPPHYVMETTVREMISS